MPRRISTQAGPGISGCSVHVPQRRVSLERWCAWTQSSWPKTRAVVGSAFRVCGPDENVYTLAATAVLRLILNYEVDPASIGFLGLGTESSRDNAAGAVIVKGMVDDVLIGLGRAPISRACEVPEFKHACLGGVYAMKGALRYLATDGASRVAIVVSADVAEYARGSSGEATQGAGAVAFLLEPQARMLELDLARSGRAAEYRGIDFRKPMVRHFMPGYGAATARVRDFPVFNGRYSTSCYVDAVNHALDELAAQVERPRAAFVEEADALFFHRPYGHMPVQALAASLVWGATRDLHSQGKLATWCAAAELSVAEVLAECRPETRLIDVVNAVGPQADSAPHTKALIRSVRASSWFKALAAEKFALGSNMVREVGNLYTASLPAWIAAGFEDAATQGKAMDDASWLLVGYGSGDAAEAMLARVVPGWEAQAHKVGFAKALSTPRELSQEQYEALHDGRDVDVGESSGGFVIARVGERNEDAYQDIGVEYYDWKGEPEAAA